MRNRSFIMHAVSFFGRKTSVAGALCLSLSVFPTLAPAGNCGSGVNFQQGSVSSPIVVMHGWPGVRKMDIHGHTAADYAPFSNSYSGRGHMWHSTGQGIAGSHTATYPIWTTTPVQVPTAPNMTGTTATAPAAVARVRTCRLTRDSVPAVRIRAIPTTIEALRASGVPELHKDEVRYGVYNNHPGFARSDIIIGSPRTVYVFRPGAAVGLGTDLTGVDC